MCRNWIPVCCCALRPQPFCPAICPRLHVIRAHSLYTWAQVHTICVGCAIGQAALLLSAGSPKQRFMLPHSTGAERPNDFGDKFCGVLLRWLLCERFSSRQARKTLGNPCWFMPDKGLSVLLADSAHNRESIRVLCQLVSTTVPAGLSKCDFLKCHSITVTSLVSPLASIQVLFTVLSIECIYESLPVLLFRSNDPATASTRGRTHACH